MCGLLGAIHSAAGAIAATASRVVSGRKCRRLTSAQNRFDGPAAGESGMMGLAGGTPDSAFARKPAALAWMMDVWSAIAQACCHYSEHPTVMIGILI